MCTFILVNTVTNILDNRQEKQQIFMAIGSLKQNSLTFPWLLAQNKITWLFPDFSLTIIFFPVFPVFQTLWEPCRCRWWTAGGNLPLIVIAVTRQLPTCARYNGCGTNWHMLGGRAHCEAAQSPTALKGTKWFDWESPMIIDYLSVGAACYVAL